MLERTGFRTPSLDGYRVVLTRLVATWQQWREDRQARRHAIPELLWQSVLRDLPFVAARQASDLARLRHLCSLFLARKEFHGAHGLVVTDEMALTVAVQACLPLLHLGLAAYDGFVGVVLHADEVVAARERVDDAGVVHTYEETLSGEAMAGGPMMLSWADVAAAGTAAEVGYNVVLHECAHVLDMADGLADGVPLLHSAADRLAWRDVLLRAYDSFCDQVVHGDDCVLDPYGVQSPEEFFAVAVEAFFTVPVALKRAQPALYELLAKYFQQDTASAAA